MLTLSLQGFLSLFILPATSGTRSSALCGWKAEKAELWCDFSSTIALTQLDISQKEAAPQWTGHLDPLLDLFLHSLQQTTPTLRNLSPACFVVAGS